MFPFGFPVHLGVVLLISMAVALAGLVGWGTVALAWGLAFVCLFGLLLARDGQGGVRRAGVALLVAVALGLGFAYGMHPALAHAATDLVWHGGLASDLLSPVSDGLPLIAAPPGDTGLWTGINGYLAEGAGAIVAAFATWALKEVAVHTRIKIRADQEAQIRETMRTGVFAGIEELELEVDKHWTPAQRQQLLAKVAAWAKDRAATQLKKLGLPGFVVDAMASKVLSDVLSLAGGVDTAQLIANITGNPGETPALDRVDGGKGGN